MQVGYHEQALLLPEQRAGEIGGDQGHAGDIDDRWSVRWRLLIEESRNARVPSRSIQSPP